jgi:hypothetical protein
MRKQIFPPFQKSKVVSKLGTFEIISRVSYITIFEDHQMNNHFSTHDHHGTKIYFNEEFTHETYTRRELNVQVMSQ